MAETEAQSTINLEQTINDCFAFEKKCRVAGDTPSLKAICVHIVRYHTHVTVYLHVPVLSNVHSNELHT